MNDVDYINHSMNDDGCVTSMSDLSSQTISSKRKHEQITQNRFLQLTVPS